MSELVIYDAACAAIAKAKHVDEVKEIRDRAMAARLYAKQAKNRTLEMDAIAIRFRAERRLGEVLEAQKALPREQGGGMNRGRAGTGDVNVGRGTGGARKEPPVDPTPTLAEMGIDKKLSSRAQALARVPAAEFEARVEQARTATAKPVRAVPKPQPKKAETDLSRGLRELREWRRKYQRIEAFLPIFEAIDVVEREVA